MSILIPAVIAVVAGWFGYSIVKKLKYFASVERHLEGKGTNPRAIQEKVGKQRYINAMSFLKQRRVAPDECASLLKMYVIHGMGEYITSPPTDFQEHRLLQLLGYIKS